MDGFAVEFDLEGVGLVAFAFALGAGDVEVAEELHFDFLEAVSGAAFTAALAGVEREEAGGDALGFGVFGGGEEVSDGVEGADVNGGGGARGAGEWALVHHDDLADFFVAGDAADDAGFVFGDFAAEALQIAIEDLVDEGALAGAGDAGEAAEDAEGELDIELFEVVLAGAGDFEVVLGFAPGGGDGDSFAAGEVVGGEGAL